MDALGRQLQASITLAHRYDAALRELPDRADLLSHLRDAHLQHATALADRICATTDSALPLPTMVGADAEVILDGLRELERSARRQATQACLAAPAEQAVLFGTIAAALAGHEEALRR
jgi:hypothetical protein